MNLEENPNLERQELSVRHRARGFAVDLLAGELHETSRKLRYLQQELRRLTDERDSARQALGKVLGVPKPEREKLGLGELVAKVKERVGEAAGEEGES